MAYQELDLFGNVITYPVMCISCQESFEIEQEPPTKQLSFYVCEECRDVQRYEHDPSGVCGENTENR